MNSTCHAFWMLQTIIGTIPIPPGFSLTYHTAFLQPASTPLATPYPARPPPPLNTPSAGDRILWRGKRD